MGLLKFLRGNRILLLVVDVCKLYKKMVVEKGSDLKWGTSSRSQTNGRNQVVTPMFGHSSPGSMEFITD